MFICYMKAIVEHQNKSVDDAIRNLERMRIRWDAIKDKGYLPGGFDDAVANALHEAQLLVGYYAFLKYNKKAMDALDSDDLQVIASDFLLALQNSDVDFFVGQWPEGLE